MMKKNRLYLIIYIWALLLAMPMLWSCSSTSALKEGEQLFTGLKPIEYVNYEKSSYADTTILEM